MNCCELKSGLSTFTTIVPVVAMTLASATVSEPAPAGVTVGSFGATVSAVVAFETVRVTLSSLPAATVIDHCHALKSGGYVHVSVSPCREGACSASDGAAHLFAAKGCEREI